MAGGQAPTVPRSRVLLPVLSTTLLTTAWMVTLAVLGYWWFDDLLAPLANGEAGREIRPLDPHVLTRPLALLVLVLAPVIGLVLAVRDRRRELVVGYAALLVPTGFVISAYLFPL